MKGLTSAAGQKANGEKVKLACDMGGGEGRMLPEGLYARGERLKLHWDRTGRDGYIGAVGM